MVLSVRAAQTEAEKGLWAGRASSSCSAASYTTWAVFCDQGKAAGAGSSSTCPSSASIAAQACTSSGFSACLSRLASSCDAAPPWVYDRQQVAHTLRIVLLAHSSALLADDLLAYSLQQNVGNVGKVRTSSSPRRSSDSDVQPLSIRKALSDAFHSLCAMRSMQTRSVRSNQMKTAAVNMLSWACRPPWLR